MTQENALDKKPEPKSDKAILLLGPFSFLMICFILSTALMASIVLLDPSERDLSYEGLALLDTAVIVISALLAIITLPIALTGIVLYLTTWKSTRNKLVNRLMILSSILFAIGLIEVIVFFFIVLKQTPG